MTPPARGSVAPVQLRAVEAEVQPEVQPEVPPGVRAEAGATAKTVPTATSHDAAGTLAAEMLAAPTPAATAEPLRPAEQAMPARPDLSVVVPTFRRAALLENCLHALVAQDYDPTRYEIIVCDDGPDDDTRALVERTADAARARGLVVRYVPVTRTQGPAGARNAGWRAAHAPLIAFTDDDTVPDPHWLSAGREAMSASGAAAACGDIVVPLPTRPTDYEADAAGLTVAEFATANAFVTRAFLHQTGGFDERFTQAWREDSDLQFSIMRAGGRVEHARGAVVVHPVRPAPWGVSIAQQRKAQFEALLYSKHPELYRQRIRRWPPLHYYAIAAGALLALAGALAGVVELAACGAAVWFAFTLAFFVRRMNGTSHRWRHIAEMAWTSVLIPFLSLYWRLYGAFRYRVWFL